MKTKLKIASFLVVIASVIVNTGCDGGSNGPSFAVVTVSNLNGLAKPDPFVGVSGFANAPSIFCVANPSGTGAFRGTTDGNARFTVGNAAVGGTVCAWTFNRGPSANCPNPNPAGTTVANVTNGSTPNVPCNGATIFSASPNPIDVSDPPSTITITGQGMLDTYGAPLVTFYDGNDNALLSVTATAASSDGTSIVIPGWQIASFGNGGYGAVVYVKQSDGTWVSVGGAGLYVFSPDSPPPPPDDPTPDLLAG